MTTTNGSAPAWTHTVTPHEARIVLDVAGFDSCRGYASDWGRQLCQLAFKADRVNRAKLRLSFPAMVDAVDLFQNQPEGLAVIQALADQRS